MFTVVIDINLDYSDSPAVRNPFPMRSYPHYPPQRPGFLPPPPPPENRVEPPQLNPSAVEQPEPKHET